MKGLDYFIENLNRDLPKHCTVKDLIKAGIYTSPHNARTHRVTGDSPAYFKIGTRIVYPKESVLEWLEEKKHYANSAQKTH